MIPNLLFCMCHLLALRSSQRTTTRVKKLLDTNLQLVAIADQILTESQSLSFELEYLLSALCHFAR